MSSEPWENNDEPGIFEGHREGSWTSDQDMHGTGQRDGGLDWDELENEYYKDFDRRAANPVDYQYKYEDQPNGKKKARKFSTKKHKHIEEERNQNQDTEVNGKPYREETVKVTNIRRARGYRRRVFNPYKYRRGAGRYLVPPSLVDCPECDEQVGFEQCLRCEKFQVWDDLDGELRRCYHEFLDLKSRGYYDGTWDDHPENFDPETFERIQEQKRLNEEINREMALERAEFERQAKELEKNGDSVYEYLKNRYGEYEEEEDNDDQDEKDDDYDDEEEFYK